MILAAIAALTLATDVLDPDERTDPRANFSARAVVMSATTLPATDDGMQWTRVSLRISECVAGPCESPQVLELEVPAMKWNGQVGQLMGVLGYAWRDSRTQVRTWHQVLSLDDDVEKERFDRESEIAAEK